MTPYRGPGIWLMNFDPNDSDSGLFTRAFHDWVLGYVPGNKSLAQLQALDICSFFQNNPTCEMSHQSFCAVAHTWAKQWHKTSICQMFCKGLQRNNAFKCCIWSTNCQSDWGVAIEVPNFESCSSQHNFWVLKPKLNVFTTSAQLVDGGLGGVKTRMAEGQEEEEEEVLLMEKIRLTSWAW